MLPPVLGAVLTAAVTPFDTEGAVDDAAYRALVRYLLANGSDGIVVAGTTGEASTLTDDERIALFRSTAEECAGIGTVVAGTGSNDTAHSVHLTEVAKGIGVDAVLVVTPYYNRPPAEGIRRHVAAIAEVGVPVVLYNIPGRTGINMPPDLIAGDTLEDLDASVRAARQAVAQIRERLASEVRAEASRGFPVGAPARGPQSTRGLSSAEKIEAGLSERLL